MNGIDFSVILLTIQLACITTLLLLVLGGPIAWWLSRSRSRLKPTVEAITTLPLVLPPTVLGFYFLVVFNPHTPLGSFVVFLTGESLTFSFQGLVVASIIYSMPFMIQPLKIAFDKLDQGILESARVLGANPWVCLYRIVIPSCIRGIVSAMVLTFAHTVGEFGVVLMIGGNIPGKTRVISIAIYEHVETLNYESAHMLALGLIVFSFLTLLVVYAMNREPAVRLT